MPHFLEQHGDPQIPPPYSFPNVTIYSFRLASNESALRTLCDARLNIGTREQRGFEYRPILPFVDLEVLHYPRMISENKRFAWGWTTQIESYFRIFVGRYNYTPDGPLPVEAAVFIPYIFVDNAWSVVSGRDVVGFPKVMASFDLPKFDNDQTRLYPMRIMTDVFELYSVKTPQAARPIVEIERSQVGPGSGDVPSETIWPWGVFNPKQVDPALLPFLKDRTRFETVQLKQIRDAEQSELACYQALIHARFDIVRIEPLKILPAAEVTIPRYDSLRIEEELGLMGEPLQSLWQYTVNCDLRYGNVRNLFVNT